MNLSGKVFGYANTMRAYPAGRRVNRHVSGKFVADDISIVLLGVHVALSGGAGHVEDGGE